MLDSDQLPEWLHAEGEEEDDESLGTLAASMANEKERNLPDEAELPDWLIEPIADPNGDDVQGDDDLWPPIDEVAYSEGEDIPAWLIESDLEPADSLLENLPDSEETLLPAPESDLDWLSVLNIGSDASSDEPADPSEEVFRTTDWITPEKQREELVEERREGQILDYAGKEDVLPPLDESIFQNQDDSFLVDEISFEESAGWNAEMTGETTDEPLPDWLTAEVEDAPSIPETESGDEMHLDEWLDLTGEISSHEGRDLDDDAKMTGWLSELSGDVQSSREGLESAAAAEEEDQESVPDGANLYSWLENLDVVEPESGGELEEDGFYEAPTLAESPPDEGDSASVDGAGTGFTAWLLEEEESEKINPQDASEFESMDSLDDWPSPDDKVPDWLVEARQESTEQGSIADAGRSDSPTDKTSETEQGTPDLAEVSENIDENEDELLTELIALRQTRKKAEPAVNSVAPDWLRAGDIDSRQPTYKQVGGPLDGMFDVIPIAPVIARPITEEKIQNVVPSVSERPSNLTRVQEEERITLLSAVIGRGEKDKLFPVPNTDRHKRKQVNQSSWRRVLLLALLVIVFLIFLWLYRPEIFSIFQTDWLRSLGWG